MKSLLRIAKSVGTAYLLVATLMFGGGFGFVVGVAAATYAQEGMDQ